MNLEKDNWIVIGKRKIKNPYLKGILDQEIVSADKFDFQHQTENYNKILQILDKYKIHPTDVVMGKYPSKCINSNGVLVTFIMLTDNSSIAWHKYEGNKNGGGQNLIIANNKIYKLSTIVNQSTNLDTIFK